MSQIVVDTDVASYIFNWHASAQRYIDALRGSQLILCFMSIAEMRMGAISAGWGVRRRTLQGGSVNAPSVPDFPSPGFPLSQKRR
jgi:predicted nucleic acid-binding protein